ncbi:MAG TPA: ABC transporter ATP-binding protein [Candidatus Acidoferrales bacterium]|nr:ABC transporter ATP-binding protein [Candidatus Acidoferrales bacterium]
MTTPTRTNSQTTSEKPPRSGRLRLRRLLQPHVLSLAIASVAVLGETITDILDPWPIKIVIDNIVQSKKPAGWMATFVAHTFGDDKLATLNFAIAAVLAISVVGALSSYVEKYMTTTTGQWVAHDLRRTLYTHIQRLSLAQYDSTRTADLVSRVTSDVDAIQTFVNSALLGSIVSVLTLVGMAGVMFYINWKFTLIALSIVPALFVTVYYLTRRIKKASRDVRKTESELMTVAEEALSSARVVKAFSREDHEIRRFEAESLENVETSLKARGLKAKLSPLVEILTAVGTCLVLGYGTRLALKGTISAGVLIVFLLYLSRMYKPMRDLSKMTDSVSKASVGYERIQEILEVPSGLRDLPQAKRAPRFKGHIEFENVGFSYDGQNPVLTDVSFKVEPGQVAALVGPSGTGKTTIVSLISRFYDPSSGRVKIDGQDIRRYRLKSLREQMSFVLQETLLFHTTIWENIAYGKPDAKPEQIVRASQLANAEEFIKKLPEGYDTLVGERGMSLSGGQRQRIAIARAIVRDTPILILDEPTSGLDASSEQIVLEALRRLMKDRTCVVIAHDLESIRHSDVIFVVQDSAIIERGTHDQLLALGGEYAGLYNTQSPETRETVSRR